MHVLDFFLLIGNNNFFFSFIESSNFIAITSLQELGQGEIGDTFWDSQLNSV